MVGNVTVGGTGKTPLIIWLAQFLQQQGYQPGIISRGYKAQADKFPILVTEESDVNQVGDEAMVLAHRTMCPIVIDPNRVAAAKHLLKNTDCDVILSDDGLQHYALDRDIEIAVIDGMRAFGNRLFLPAGPLREPISRLQKVDMLVINGSTASEGQFQMDLIQGDLHNLTDPQLVQPLNIISGETVHAVAGIGNPQRFFATLRSQGFSLIEHAFPDHHYYTREDLNFNDDLVVIMTEKDAVKCKNLCEYNYWYLPVTANMDSEFKKALISKLHLVKALKERAKDDLLNL